MTIEAAIYAALIGSSAVATAIGTDDNGDVKVYDTEAPRHTDGTVLVVEPYVTFQRLSRASVHHQGNAAPFSQSLYQVDVWGRSTVETVKIADLIRNLFDGFRGDLSGETIQAIFLRDDAHEHVPPVGGRQRGTYRARMDFEIWHVVSVPTHT